MLLLMVIAPTEAGHHRFRDLFSPDRLFDTVQHLLINVAPKVLLTIFIAIVFIKVLGFFIGRMPWLAEKHAAPPSRIAQARTLSSVLRATSIAVVSFLALLQILPLLGFDLAPLLTSAGVAGVAVGLACQTVVKDCINGMLIVVEDQYNVGDVIKVAALTGQVEALSLRKTTLRDGDGTLYIIPNSQITTVANMTRDYSVATVNVEVDYSADPDKVIAVLREAAMSIRNDPAFKNAFLEDPTLLGVDAVKGSQITYPITLKTRANEQWGPKRELQRRVRLALDEHGMLPGDPLRAIAQSGHGHQPEPAPDPTALRAQEINPLTGEGL